MGSQVSPSIGGAIQSGIEQAIAQAAPGLIQGLIQALIGAIGNINFGNLFHHASTPPPTPVVVGSTTVTPQPPPVTVTVPTHIAGADIALLRIVHGLVQDRNHNDVPPERMATVDAPGSTDNLDDGSFIHTDCSPMMDDGSELVTGDPRWATVQRGVLGDKKPLAIWFYYVYDGRSTLDGFHSPFVEPQSVEDDERCTVTYHVAPTDGKQHTFAYGYQYLRWDGRLVDPGPIGRGNKSLLSGGSPFTIK